MGYSETLRLIEDRLSEFLHNSRFSSFYIGQTNDFERRAEEHRNNEGYNYVWSIAEGSPSAINQAEIDLIKFFRENQNQVIPLDNKINGGAGNDSNTIYVAVKATINEVGDLYDGLVSINGLENIKIPEVND